MFAGLHVGAHGELHGPANSALSRAAKGVIKDDYVARAILAAPVMRVSLSRGSVSGSSRLSRVAGFTLNALFWHQALADDPS